MVSGLLAVAPMSIAVPPPNSEEYFQLTRDNPWTMLGWLEPAVSWPKTSPSPIDPVTSVPSRTTSGGPRVRRSADRWTLRPAVDDNRNGDGRQADARTVADHDRPGARARVVTRVARRNVEIDRRLRSGVVRVGGRDRLFERAGPAGVRVDHGERARQEHQLFQPLNRRPPPPRNRHTTNTVIRAVTDQRVIGTW